MGIVYCRIVEVDRIRIKPSWLSKKKKYWLVPLRARACRVIHEWGFI